MWKSLWLIRQILGYFVDIDTTFTTQPKVQFSILEIFSKNRQIFRPLYFLKYFNEYRFLNIFGKNNWKRPDKGKQFLLFFCEKILLYYTKQYRTYENFITNLFDNDPEMLPFSVQSVLQSVESRWIEFFLHWSTIFSFFCHFCHTWFP